MPGVLKLQAIWPSGEMAMRPPSAAQSVELLMDNFVGGLLQRHALEADEIADLAGHT